MIFSPQNSYTEVLSSAIHLWYLFMRFTRIIWAPYEAGRVLKMSLRLFWNTGGICKASTEMQVTYNPNKCLWGNLVSSQDREISYTPPLLLPDRRIAAVSVWLIIAGQISHHAPSPLHKIETDSMRVHFPCRGEIPEGCFSSESGGRRFKEWRIKQIAALWKKSVVCWLVCCCLHMGYS